MENKTEKKGGNKIKFIAIGLVALIIVGAGGYFGYSKFAKDKGTQKTAAPAAVQTAQTTTQAKTTQNQSYLEQIVSEKNIGLDECLVNLADEDGKRYVKTKIFVGYDKNSKLETELTEKKPLIRDAVIAVLRSKKAAEITPKNMDSLKMELIQKINPLLKKGQINNVYFSDLLVQ
ncbi:flagellar basal body protein FliL [Clostridium carboxidivorans P7]|uniref:flagellar basal body-associated FliL family protein n=1 Tax=Clostridium carboxidivorans TaxID=217159 RepID=UPI0001D3941F|nr:flagellar basal body-associated FliL family protein [Clostridium carboxidivorans]AKN33959.1 flagellar basal body protein FliL [Clostridium carboxidivorans P7]EFG88166.1 flagellar basal body-associated protein FliL [Clostridium carboxidivorans P7]